MRKRRVRVCMQSEHMIITRWGHHELAHEAHAAVALFRYIFLQSREAGEIMRSDFFV